MVKPVPTNKRKKKWVRIMLAVILSLLLWVLGFVAFLTIFQYRPDPIEDVPLVGDAQELLEIGKELRLVTFNLGYGSLDETQDFFMDGGKGVRPTDESFVKANTAAFNQYLRAGEFDIALLQEVDQRAKRSYYYNMVDSLYGTMGGQYAFATNYVSQYVPYPLPNTLGPVRSGILTISPYQSTSALRVALPSSFKWPVSVAQLKRCLLVQKLSIAGSDKKLVLINLHLEAYSDMATKQAQAIMLAEVMQMAYEEGHYVLAGGDFNQTFAGVDLTKYPVLHSDYFVAETLPASILPAGFTTAFDDTTPTTRLPNQPYLGNEDVAQFYVIDGYIVSPNIEVVAVETKQLNFKYSDHNPVELTVKLK